MEIRLAKPNDAKQLAQLHWICSAEQSGGFMFNLGKTFLKEYYRILLAEKNSVVLCTQESDGNIIGLVSGSLKAEEHIAALRRHRFALMLAASPALVSNPWLINEMYARQQVKSVDKENSGYIVMSGPREEFWAWLPAKRSMGGAIELHKKWLKLMRLLGAPNVKLEVDRVNERVGKMHYLMGASLLREFVTPDGRQRLVLEYTLSD